MKKSTKFFSAILLLSVLVAGCKGLWVTTYAPEHVSDNSAVCGGRVKVPEDKTVTAVGLCWSTSKSPTVSDDYMVLEDSTLSFSLTIPELEPNTTYFVRAFALCDSVYKYGANKSFTTSLNGRICWGERTTLPGLFSVGRGRKVRFSPGNLQYNAYYKVWRFAENQWDCIGSSNRYIEENYGGWIDLFGWGTSGVNPSGSSINQPWKSSSSNGDYKAYGNAMLDLSDNNGHADWGYNAICNGGDMENVWHTLSQSEWDYLLNARETPSRARFAKAKVAGVKGVILLPDNWRTSYYYLSGINEGYRSFTTNIIPDERWASLEQHGAVFLPCAGDRSWVTFSNGNEIGCYWSVSHATESDAYSVYFDSSKVDANHTDMRSKGLAVRLVRYTE